MIAWLNRIAETVQKRLSELTALERAIVVAMTSLASLLMALLGILFRDLLEQLAFWAVAAGIVLLAALLTLLVLTAAHSRQDLRQFRDLTRFRRTYHRLESGSTLALNKEIDAFIRQAFGIATVDEDRVDAIRAKHPLISVKLMEKREAAGRQKLAGVASCWPVTEPFYRDFVTGKLEEKDLTAEHVLPLGERHEVRYLYIPVVLVSQPKTLEGAFQSVSLNFGLLDLIDRLYGNNRHEVTIFTVGYSPEGRALARNVYKLDEGVSLQGYGQDCTLFKKTVTAGQLSSECQVAKQRMFLEFLKLEPEAASEGA